MAELAGSPGLEEVAITTSPNTAYEVMKQHGQGGRIEVDYGVMTGDPPPDIDEAYEIPSLHITHQPLPVAPPTSSNVGVAKEEEGVYMSILGDK